MLRNYFKIAWRNIIKQRLYSVINIAGLSVGIAFTLIIAAYVWNELHVNRELRNADNQYIIQSKWKNPNQGYEIATLGGLAKALKENYPNLVANFYRYDGITSNVSKDDKSFREGLQVGDSTILEMYGFKLLYGNPHTALNDPFTAVITADKAIKYFGKIDVIGQTITIENFSGSKHDFIITGILKKISRNSVTLLVDDYPNDIYVSAANLAFFGRNMDWNNPTIASYVELQKGIKPEDLEKPIQFLLKQNAPLVADNMTPYLMSLKKYYLASNNDLVKKTLYTLSCITIFILLMAIVNFINLSVSRSATRMREIGVRKVLGGMKKQLIFQFLAESTLLVFFSTLFAFIIYSAVKDLFSNIMGKSIPALTHLPFYFLGLSFLFILVIGTIAGLYPAFVLSSVKCVESLKGKLKTVKEQVLLRKSLVAFQFSIAAIVFIGAIIISQQINLFFSKSLGYNKDYIISAQVPRDWSIAGVSKMENTRSWFALMPQIENATLSFEVPNGANSGIIYVYKNGTDSSTAISLQLITTDEYYASTYGIPMAAGIFYSSPGAYTDSTKLVINETGAKKFGWKNAQDALGGQLKFPGSNTVYSIAGVTKDFHFGSMQQAIQPYIFFHVGVGNIFRFLSFKLKPGNISASITALQKQWSSVMPGAPFEYKFMDETLAQLYKTEIQLKRSSYVATILSFIIVLLGIFGLVALSIQKRTKEVGIRKVLGASVSNIMSLFMKEFGFIIIIAGAIASPLAYIIMSRWLQAYVYRIDLTAIPFITAILLLSLITGILICLQSLKTAVANPVKNLRTE